MQNLEYQNYELKDLVINIMGNELSQTEYDLKNFKIEYGDRNINFGKK